MKLKMRFNSRQLMEFIIVILLIILSGTVALSTREDASIARVLYILMIVLCFIYGFKYCHSRVAARKAIVVFCVCFVYAIVEFFIYYKTILGFSMRMMWVVAFTYLLTSPYFDVKIFMCRIYQIIVILSIATFIAFILVNITKTATDFDYIANGENVYYYRRYYGFFYTSFTYLRTVLGFEMYRLQSIFWEPGIYAVYLVYAIYYFVFYDKKKNKWIMYLLSICLALTFSTTGLCIGIVLFFIWLVENARVNNRSKMLIILPSVLVVIIGVVTIWQNKKNAGSMVLYGSYNLRRLDMLNGLELFIQRPIFGWGFKIDGVFETYQNLGRGNSNGLITVGYNLGIVGLIAFLLPFVLCVYKCQKNKRFSEIVFSLIFVITNLTEPLEFMPFMIFLLMYEYSKLGTKSKSLKNELTVKEYKKQNRLLLRKTECQ